MTLKTHVYMIKNRIIKNYKERRLRFEVFSLDTFSKKTSAAFKPGMIG